MTAAGGRKTETRVDGELLELSLVNDLREIATVAAQIDKFCAAGHLAPHIAYAVNLSVEEILTNTISSGYDDNEPHEIAIMVILDASRLVVEIIDDARACDPSSGADHNVETSLEDRSVVGLGLFLAHQMMDSIEYEYVDGCNILILTKDTIDGDADTDSPSK